MTTWRTVAAATGAALAVGLTTPATGAAAAPATGATAPQAVAGPRPGTGTQGVAATRPGAATQGVAAGAPTVRCPRVTAPRAPGRRPPAPRTPAADPVLRTVGGEALATAGLAVPPGVPAPPALTARTWLVADLDTGAVLGACGAHEFATPASVQKLLLTATVLPRLNPAQVVTVSRRDLAFEPGSSAVGLLEGGRYTVGLLWLGLLLNSGNDAANVLARLGGGTAGVPGTLKAMNAEAARLGAYQTHAVTPSGLDGPGQFTSAYDLALIARACFANPTFRRYQRTERAQVPAQRALKKPGFQIQNDNRLLFEYPGALGGKTGFTDLARHTYVGFAERGGRRLVVTVLGAEARPLRGWQQGAALLDWGFRLPKGATTGRLVDPGEPDPRRAAESATAPSPAPDGPDGPAGAGRPGGTDGALSALPAASTWRTGAAAGMALALVAGPLLALALTRSERRRRDRRRAPGRATGAGSRRR